MMIGDTWERIKEYIFFFRFVIVGFCVLMLIFISAKVGAMYSCKVSEGYNLEGFVCQDIKVIDVCHDLSEDKYYKMVNNKETYTGTNYTLTG